MVEVGAGEGAGLQVPHGLAHVLVTEGRHWHMAYMLKPVNQQT